MSLYRTQNGFSIFEALLSTSVGFIVLIIAAYLVLKQSEELNVLRDRIEVNNVQLEIQRALMDPATCLAPRAPETAVA